MSRRCGSRPIWNHFVSNRRVDYLTPYVPEDVPDRLHKLIGDINGIDKLDDDKLAAYVRRAWGFELVESDVTMGMIRLSVPVSWSDHGLRVEVTLLLKGMGRKAFGLNSIHFAGEYDPEALLEPFMSERLRRDLLEPFGRLLALGKLTDKMLARVLRTDRSYFPEEDISVNDTGGQLSVTARTKLFGNATSTGGGSAAYVILSASRSAGAGHLIERGETIIAWG